MECFHSYLFLTMHAWGKQEWAGTEPITPTSKTGWVQGVAVTSQVLWCVFSQSKRVSSSCSMLAMYCFSAQGRTHVTKSNHSTQAFLTSNRKQYKHNKWTASTFCFSWNDRATSCRSEGAVFTVQNCPVITVHGWKGNQARCEWRVYWGTRVENKLHLNI